ncbi:MAG: extracellular solute-binding protein [Xanthobacteraceae bacterium]
MPLTRRDLIRGTALAAASPTLAALAQPQPPTAPPAHAPAPPPPEPGMKLPFRHGLSMFGDLKYPPDFKHFDYVNPEAPKGGVVRQSALGTFDNFNVAVGGAKGLIAAGADMLYDTLMARALDEVSAEYGLLAEGASVPEDFSSVTFRLRPHARWHDGKPVTPQDVIFSFEAFRKHHPQFMADFRHVAKAEQTGEREVTFRFDQPGNRELPQVVGRFQVLPKHWWEGSDKDGKKRDVSATTLELPLGSGAYRIKEFVAGRSVVFERVPDYWGKDLPVNVGRDNFNEIRFEYFRDTTIALEAFKADHMDWRVEPSAKNWATVYDFPAVQDKRVVLEEFPVRHLGFMQAFAFNIRRDKFKDSRVRRAFNYAFNFEEINKQIFFGEYKRITSYFQGTELASSGLPEGLELEILETVRSEVPPDVFTTPYTNPAGGSQEAMRTNLRTASQLLRDAGYDIRDQKLVDAKTGEPYAVEFLAFDPSTERFILFYKPSLEKLGITVEVRTVDDAQFENRLRQWDFDVIIATWPETLSPGNEQRSNWGSEAADQPGSHNLIGIKNAAIDKLIDRVVFAKNRAELVAATRALDRVLLHHHFVVPQWTYGKLRTARWDRFAKPHRMPEYGLTAFPTIWWWDAARAAKVNGRQ